MKIQNKVLHFDAHFKAKDTTGDSVKISGFASTSDTDRAGDVILPEAWSKGGVVNYQKNPIILFNHNYNKPIGKATSVTVTDRGLEIDATISKADDTVMQLIKDEVLSTFSVGFMIKDADYIEQTNGLLIKDAELFEVSVVSVPMNQDATFSLAKSFDSEQDYKEFINQFVESTELSADEKAKAQTSVDDTEDGDDPPNKETKMTPEELKQLVADATKKAAEDAAKSTVDAITKATADKKNAEDAALEAEKQFDIKVASSAEKLMADIEKRFTEKNESMDSLVKELQTELKEKADEIKSLQTSKRVFSNRNDNNKTWQKEFEAEIVDAALLGIASEKHWETDLAKGLIEKVNAHSGVEVSSEDFEQIVSTSIERDIELELVLKPLFREINMTSASMILPVMPDAGYAQFASPATYATRNGTQTAPHGNLDDRAASFGDNAGVALGEKTLTTKKLISTSFLGNETEEDAIMPILPLIRESMVRSHARSIEQSLLLGNSSQGIYTSGIFDGLTEMAVDASTDANAGASGFAATDAVTAADLFALRKSMGKYGLRPDDVVFIVSLDAYYNLIEDVEFEDVNLVGNLATKVRGEVGRVYGTKVLVCDEFPTKAAAAFNAVCVNTRNYLIPRLRGMRVESDYDVQEQRRVLVVSQRFGFDDIIADAASVASLQYKLT